MRLPFLKFAAIIQCSKRDMPPPKGGNERAAQTVFGCSCASASLYQGCDCHWVIGKRKMWLSRPVEAAGAEAVEREQSAFSTPQA
jgi:hypothetical protein